MKRVYFIKPVGMDGPIKIGCSYSPDRRRETLAFWSPFALEIVAEFDGGDKVERQFHARHRSSHQRREWFDASPMLLADIAAINDGSFDPKCLPDPQLLPRKQIDRSYMTAEWSYRNSVNARLRRVKWPIPQEALSAILGDCLDSTEWLPHRDKIEAVVASLRAEHGITNRREKAVA